MLSHVWLFCDPMDCIPPGSSVHGISQARMLEWVAISFSRGCSWPRDQTPISCIACGFSTTEPPGKLSSHFCSLTHLLLSLCFPPPGIPSSDLLTLYCICPLRPISNASPLWCFSWLPGPWVWLLSLHLSDLPPSSLLYQPSLLPKLVAPQIMIRMMVENQFYVIGKWLRDQLKERLLYHQLICVPFSPGDLIN